MRTRLLVPVVMVLATRVALADDEARAEMKLDSRPHVGVPFTLTLQTDGFDQSPQPEQPKLEIPGAKVTPLAVPPPGISRGIRIDNGHRTDVTSVLWQFQWRVEVAKEGPIQVPSLTIKQGTKSATSQGGAVEVGAVRTTSDMRIELSLPGRAVFVGESIPVTLSWLFRAQPQGDPIFTVPLFDNDSFTVSVPNVKARRALPFVVGGQDVQLPYEVDQIDVGGTKFNRVRVSVVAAPRKAGKVTVPPASVAASLLVGRDYFRSNAEMFRATDVPHTLEVKTLPETDRPAGFAGAVGKEFTIAVSASRSVVQLGEPVELQLTIKSKERLDTLALPRLDGDGGLPKDKFTVPPDAPTGEMSDDGTTKTFKVTAQVTGPATEIPAIAFSYFDPEKERYVTTKSDPIALSVKGGSVVGAGDVVTSAPKKTATGPGETTISLDNVELALSSPGQDDDGPLSGSVLGMVVIVLYAVPLLLLGGRIWQLRTAARREEASEVKAARKKVEEALAKAATTPAREASGPLGQALRALARVLDRPVDDTGLLARLETESFAPGAAEKPLSIEVRTKAETLAKRWLGEAKPRRKAATAAVVMLLIGFAGTARADTASQLAVGRAAYQDAMALTAPTPRKAAFARAAAALGEAARSEPDRAELATDWGNAALGAGDVATATLAYRRALDVAPEASRAHKNLAYLRGRELEIFKPAAGGASDTLFFFHHWPRGRRVLVSGCAFAAMILLVVPWRGRRRRGLTGLALVPFAVWAAMLVSLGFEDRHADDAVVMEGVVIRAADSAGAPAALPQGLPPGTEVTLLERRAGWSSVRVAGGTEGWVPSGAIELVRPRK